MKSLGFRRMEDKGHVAFISFVRRVYNVWCGKVFKGLSHFGAFRTHGLFRVPQTLPCNLSSYTCSFNLGKVD